MKKIVTVLFSFLCINVFTQPAWNVDYSAYQYNMTMTGIICLEYVNSIDSSDVVGAFFRDECRGVASPSFNKEDSNYYVDLVVYSNDNNNPISFKVYSAKTGQIASIDKTINFEINKITGNQTKPYYWSNPTLSNKAVFISFGINGQTDESEILDSLVRMHFPADFRLNGVTAIFEVPERTRVTIDTALQISGETKNDFTDTVVYTVVSADETSMVHWKVITVSEITQELDAVNTITPNGDGINDYWILNNIDDFADFELSIFTSRGLKVYSSIHYQNDWNGTYKGNTLPSGAYHYILKKDKRVFSGTISLLK